MSLSKKLILSLVFTALYVIGCALIGPQVLSDEARCLFHSDLGSIIATYGILFIVFSFFNISLGLLPLMFSFVIGIGLILIGVSLSIRGMFFATFIACGYLFIISSFFENLNSLKLKIILLAIGMYCFFLRDNDTGWQKPYKTDTQMYGKSEKTKWLISLEPDSDLAMLPIQSYYIGTRANADIEAQKVVDKFNSDIFAKRKRYYSYNLYVSAAVVDREEAIEQGDISAIKCQDEMDKWAKLDAEEKEENRRSRR